MDYQGNYFPEEHDENESVTYRRIKGLFKWTMYGISFLLYAVIFFVIFTSRDSKILEKNYVATMNEFSAINTEEVELYRINAKEFMNDDGSLQIYNVDYYNELNAVEIGLKFNAKKQTGGDKGDCLEYVLIDSEENSYTLSNKITDDRGRYGFARLCFTGIDIDLASNDLRFEGGDNANRSQTTYTLIIYHNGIELHKFLIYDNSVTFYKTDYDD